MAEEYDWVKEFNDEFKKEQESQAQLASGGTKGKSLLSRISTAVDSTPPPVKSAFGPGSVFDSPTKRALDEPEETGRGQPSGFGAFSGAASPFSKGKEKEGTGFGAFSSAASPSKSNLPAWGSFGAAGATTEDSADTNSFNKPAGGGLFGQASTSTPAASTGTGFGGFGQQAQQSTAQPAASSGGLFGGFGQQNNNAATNTASTGGLFGQKPAAPATGGLFGQQQQNTTQPATGGLFGQQTQQQQQPAATGGLFGQQSQAKPAGGLFGQQSTTQPATGGLFGQQTQQQQQPAAGGLFGQQSQAKPGGLFGQQSTTAAPSGGLFGQPQQQQQQQGGLFASQQQPQQNSLFNKPAGILGNSTSFQQPQQQSGISKTAKFSDLPEGAQKVIEQMDAFFKDQRHIGQTIDAEPIGRAIWQTSSDIKVAHDEAAAIAQGLDALKHSLERLAAKVQAQAADLQKLLETWEAAKPADARHPGVRPVAHRDFPQEYFARVAAEEAERVTRYKRNIQLLSRAVTSLGADAESMTPQVVVQTIQNNQSAILALAAQLEGLEMRMNTLRANFT